MNMSRPTLYRKIKRITGLSPNGLINLTRLQHAASLLESAPYKVNEIAGMTGFLSPGSFGKAFVKQFKITPTAYQRMKKTSTVKHF
jgi:AraC-like DNA-binding protein